MAKPVAWRTQSASARPSFAPSAASAFVWSTRLAPEVITTAARIAHRNTIDLAICATEQPTAAAASAAVRVPTGNSVIVSGCPAASNAARTRSTDPPVSCPDISPGLASPVLQAKNAAQRDRGRPWYDAVLLLGSDVEKLDE